MGTNPPKASGAGRASRHSETVTESDESRDTQSRAAAGPLEVEPLHASSAAR